MAIDTLTINKVQWINNHTKLNQTNMTNGINNNLDAIVAKTNEVIAAVNKSEAMESSSYAAFNSSTSYAAGDVCFYPASGAGAKFYRRKTAGSGDWNASQWEEIKGIVPVDSALDASSTNPVQNQTVYARFAGVDGRIDQTYADMAAPYAPPYEAGEYCTHEDHLYRSTVAVAAGRAWTAGDWQQVEIGDELKGKITWGASEDDPTLSVGFAQEAAMAESIKTDRVIDDIEVSCPSIAFGTTGGGAEIQTGNNKFLYLYGNSKKWNQLIKNGNFANDDNWLTSNASLSVSSNVATFTASAQGGALYQSSIPAVVGHKYLLLADVKLTTASTAIIFRFYGQDLTASATNANTSWQRMTFIFGSVTSSGNTSLSIKDTRGSGWDAVQVKNVMVIDLTAMDIDTTNVDEAIAILKSRGIDVNQYLPYNESAILSSKSASLISRGFNQWDEETELGFINTSTGAEQASPGYIRSKWIRVLPNTTYYIKTDRSDMAVYYYDANHNYLGYAYKYNATFVTPSACSFIRISWYGTTYNHDICINLNQWGDTIDTSRNGEYVAYRSQTVTLPNIELRSVPNYADPDNPIRDVAYQIGGGKRRVGRVNLNTLSVFVHTSGSAVFQLSIPSSMNMKVSTPNCACNNLTFLGKNYERSLVADGQFIVAMDGKTIRIRKDAWANYSNSEIITALAGYVLEYELATETDIPLSENPGWTENVYTDNWGTLEFTTDPVQNPQVPQPYFIEYTISLTEFLDSAYTRASGDANNLATEEELDAIRGGNDVVGKAKLADNLESNNKTALLSAYVFGQSPTGKADSMLMDKIVGGDVAWNQLVQNGNFESSSGWTAADSSEASIAIANGKMTITYNKEFTSYGTNVYSANTVAFIAGHKYLAIATITSSVFNALTVRSSTGKFFGSLNKTTGGASIIAVTESEPSTRIYIGNYGSQTSGNSITIDNLMVIDLTQMFGSAIANYLYSLETATPGASVNKFRLLFPKPYYPYNAGELLPVRTVGRKAVGINIYNNETVAGKLNESTGELNSGVSGWLTAKDFIEVVPGNTYYSIRSSINGSTLMHMYDGSKNWLGTVDWVRNGTFTISNNCFFIRFSFTSAEYKNDICINISDPSINGAFYPYEENIYPTEDIALHGLFKLDSNNNFIADGDEYTPDGKIKRKYGIVDLGTLNWIKDTYGDSWSFYVSSISGAKVVSSNADVANFLNARYRVTATNGNTDYSNDKVTFQKAIGQVFIVDKSYNDVTAFKTAMSGVYLVYELATSTEEDAAPYASTQERGVTQQWLEPEWAEGETDIMVPVCSSATYLPDLKLKVEDAPNSPVSDGLYIVSRADGANTYISFDNAAATQEEIDEILAILQ